MNTLPRHVRLLGQSLRPSLAWLAEALDRPVPERAPVKTYPSSGADTERRLGDFRGHLVAYAEAVARLTPEVSSRPECPDAVVDRASAEVALRVAALVGDYTSVLSPAGRSGPANGKLVAVMRDNLIVIAHWMARVIKVIGQPWLFLEAASESRIGNSTTVELTTRLSFPETIAELSQWETGAVPYDREAVHEALALSMMLNEALYPDAGAFVHSTMPQPKQKRGSGGGLWWGLLLGWVLGDWFRQDCDD